MSQSKQNRHRRVIAAAAFAAAAIAAAGLLAGGCGGGNRGKEETATPSSPNSALSEITGDGQTSFTVIWPEPSRLLPAAASSVRIRLRRSATIIAEKVLARPAKGGETTATFTDLPLTSVIAEASAHPEADGSGIAQARASVAVVIQPGDNPPLRLTMASTITSIAVTPADRPLLIDRNTDLQVGATARDTAGNIVLTAGANWTWTSDNTSVVETRPETSGAVATLDGLDGGVANITVKESESRRTVTIPVRVLGVQVAISPDALSMYTARARQFAATVTGTRNTAVTWSIREGTYNTGQLSATGAYTAPAVAGTYHIVVTSKADPSQSATATVTVRYAYKITLLHEEPNIIAPSDMTAQAKLVGVSWSGTSWLIYRSFQFDTSGAAARELSAPPGFLSIEAKALNENGQIAGLVSPDNSRSRFRGFVWTPGSGFRILEALVPGEVSEAFDINNAGQVAGYVYGQNPRFQRPVIWEPDGSVTQLPLASGSVGGEVHAINQNGDCVGASDRYGDGPLATFWPRGASSAVIIGTLYPTEWSYARIINDRRQVTGISYSPQNPFRGYLWEPDGEGSVTGRMIPLADPYVIHESEPYDMNNATQIVGAYRLYNSSYSNAFLWQKDTGLLDLNAQIPNGSGWSLRSASCINDKGLIIGRGTYNGRNATYVLTPQPLE